MIDLIKDVAEAVRATMSQQQRTSPYDTSATVKRIEGDVAWIHIPGGVDETPVKLTIAAEPGDTVQVRVSGGSAWLTGNASAPPTDDKTAKKAQKSANAADKKATEAQETANTAIQDAETAHAAAESAQESADIAAAAADDAQKSADNANQYASRALGGLSTVQSVVETLNWITEHGTMTLTTDTELDPTHVYFVIDPSGDYVVGSTHYSIVSEPDADDLSTYYVLSIDESLQNYVGTHLALTGEGLWILPETSGYKVLIATGNGTQYTTPGTYIIDAVGNLVALFGSEETLITSDGLPVFSIKTSDNSETVNVRKDYWRGWYYIDPNRTVSKQFAIDLSKITSSSNLLLRFRYRIGGSDGYFSVTIAQGGSTVKTVDAMSFDIRHTNVNGNDNLTVIATTSDSSQGDHYYAWMFESVAYTAYTSAPSMSFGTRVDSNTGNGAYSFTVGEGLISGTKNQLVVGRYNKEDTTDVCLFIVGNGQSDDSRSDAFRIDFDGEFKFAIDTNPSQYTYDYDLYAAITSLGWESEVIE